ncbi:MAG: hypothetical protein PSX37_05450 [bacterium]|nr:hypothetical protein [bacterium]
MTLGPIDRTRAISLTRLSQAAGAILLVGAGVAAAMLGPRGGVAPPEALTVPELPALAPPTLAKSMSDQPVNSSVLSGRFAMIGNAPKVPEPPPVTPITEAPVAGTEPPPASGVELLYFGPAAMGGARFALVSEDSAQRIVGIGDALGDGAVKSITLNQLTIDENGTDRIIDRSPKGSEVVTKATGAAAAGGNKSSAVRKNAMVRRRPAAIPHGASGPNKTIDPAMAAAERYRMVVDKIRSSGQFGSDEATIEKAARQLMEAEGGEGAMEKDPS